MIVTLCQHIPGDCSSYFPKKVGEKRKFDEVTVGLESYDSQGYIDHRVLSVLDSSTGVST